MVSLSRRCYLTKIFILGHNSKVRTYTKAGHIQNYIPFWYRFSLKKWTSGSHGHPKVDVSLPRTKTATFWPASKMPAAAEIWKDSLGQSGVNILGNMSEIHDIWNAELFCLWTDFKNSFFLLKARTKGVTWQNKYSPLDLKANILVNV